MANIITNNKNASVAGGTTGAGALLVWAAGLAGLAIPPAIAVVAVGAITTAVLFIGKVGIKGLIRKIWSGDEADQEDGDEPEEETWEG